MSRAVLPKPKPEPPSANPSYRIVVEAMPSTNGTAISRLKRALKTLAWYRLRVRSYEEVKPTRKKRTPGRRDMAP